MTHLTGKTLPTPEKLALAEEVKIAVQAALAPIIARENAKGTCSCCIGRSVAGGLITTVGYHASAGIGDRRDIEAVVQMFTYAVSLGIAERQLETDDAPVPMAKGGPRAH